MIDELQTEGRILFVDDEPRVLEGIENLLFDAPEGWEFEFAEGGESALAKLEEVTFDVLVTDMRMPGMDGAELLARVRGVHPDIVRIVLSGHTEEEAAHRAMPLAHEFLSKPCDVDALFSTLERALRLTKRFSDVAVRRALGGIRALPTRPTTQLRLQELIEAEASLEDVAEVVGSELSLASKLLHVANTAFYSRGRTITNIRDAISLLGLKTTYVLTTAVEAWGAIGVPEWVDVDELHRHSLEVGHIASGMVERSEAADALLGGMLHDLGELVINVFFTERVREAQAQTMTQGVPRTRAEAEALGFDHAAAGAHLLRLWQLGEATAVAVENHHRPGLSQRSAVDRAVFASEWASHRPAAHPDDAMLTEDEMAAVSEARNAKEALDG
ncbi:MAG: HDOD domain-containing protein [Myxococcota bacterium]